MKERLDITQLITKQLKRALEKLAPDCELYILNSETKTDRSIITCSVLFKICLGFTNYFKLRYTDSRRKGLVQKISVKTTYGEETDKLHRFDYSPKRGYHYHIEMLGKKINKHHLGIKNICNTDDFLKFILEESLECFH